MTIDEAKSILFDMLGNKTIIESTKQNQAILTVFKALEQEPILDKVRAEIEQNAYPIVHGVNSHEKGMTLYGILQVIDKCKSESEES